MDRTSVVVLLLVAGLYALAAWVSGCMQIGESVYRPAPVHHAPWAEVIEQA